MKSAKKKFVAICLTIMAVFMAACSSHKVAIPTEQEVMDEVAKVVDGENYVLDSKKRVTHEKLNGYSGDELVDGYRYVFKSTDRELSFTADGAKYMYCQGWNYYESDVKVKYWEAIRALYLEDFNKIVKEYFSADQISPSSGGCRIEVKDVSDIDKFIACYEALNTYYALNESQYHNGQMESVYNIKLYCEDQKGSAKSTENAYSKSYYINGVSRDIRRELEADFVEQLIDKDIDIAGFDKVEYVKESGYTKTQFSKVYINSHKMTYKESAGLVKPIDYFVTYDDTKEKYAVVLCEFAYDATGTKDMGGKYTIFAHYLNAIHSETGMDYYTDFKEELNKEKFYKDGMAVTVFTYAIDGVDYEIEFDANSDGTKSTIAAKKGGVPLSIDYEASSGRFYYVDIDDFCEMLNLTWQVENADEMHFYTK